MGKRYELYTDHKSLKYIFTVESESKAKKMVGADQGL
jgi:hypothetical protein